MYATYSLYTLEDISNEQQDQYEREVLELADNPDVEFGTSIEWVDSSYYIGLLSKNHPEVVFILDTQGEGQDNIFREFFKNGKSYCITPTITFENYDESKLKL